MTQELKPCPFCGTHLRAYSEQGGYFHPIVGTCPLSGWEMLADGYSEDRWNTRPAPDVAAIDTSGYAEAIDLAAVVEALEAARDTLTFTKWFMARKHGTTNPAREDALAKIDAALQSLRGQP